MPRARRVSVLALLLALGPLGTKCADPSAIIFEPAARQLSEPGPVDVSFVLLFGFDPRSAAVVLEGEGGAEDVTHRLRRFGPFFFGELDVDAPGAYTLRVGAEGRRGSGESSRPFEIVDLPDADVCEVLNSVECLLPFPSSRFLLKDPSTPNGVRLELPALGLDTVPPLDPPIDPAPWSELDGFSPTAPVLMHFPGGVDLVASGVDRLIAPDFANPQPRPYRGVRTHAGVSLMPSSPTVILNARTGERVLHFVELDARAAGSERQALILRPAVALEPGERYVVAIRDLVDPSGNPIEPEPAFRALRDRTPTTIDAIEARRRDFEHDVFRVLRRAPVPVPREDLQLAFDYRVQSAEGLRGAVLSMQQQAYDWLEHQVDVLGNQTFSVRPFGADPPMSQEFDCSAPGATTWRILRGTFQAPLFLTEDLAMVNTVGVLNLDEDGVPVRNGVTNVAFTASIPCEAFLEGGAADHAIVLGHGLFGNGSGMVEAFSSTFAASGNYASAATDWRGLATPDLLWVGNRIIGSDGVNEFNNFPAFVDRLKQGQIDTQLLARMVKRGDFNVDPAFQVAPAVGGMPGPDEEMFYYGVSLGGIMGTFFAALTPDVRRFNLDVPAMNFSLLLQRASPFTVFEGLVRNVGLTDPLEVLVSYSLQHELWVRAEPAGYVGLLADDIAAGEKQVLVTAAWLDKQVSNQATEILARSLGIPHLEGSVQEGLVGIPDVSGTVDNAYVIYDQGTFDIYDPVQTLRYIPPLRNVIPNTVCDPHPVRVTIPASVDQLLAFLQPGGRIRNFCDGVCDGTIPYEQPGGGPPCMLP